MLLGRGGGSARSFEGLYLYPKLPNSIHVYITLAFLSPWIIRYRYLISSINFGSLFLCEFREAARFRVLECN